MRKRSKSSATPADNALQRVASPAAEGRPSALPPRAPLRPRILAVGGLVVLSGGVLMALVNAVLTPLLPLDAPFGELAASRAFVVRQVLAIGAALILCIGSIPLYLGHAERTGAVGMTAFLGAFVGSALLLAHEWNQVFFVHDLARSAPAALEAMEDAPGLTLFDFGALLAVSSFSVGWIAFAASMLAHRVYSRLGPALLIGGFFLVPVLSAALPRPYGQIVGTLVLGSGWIVLGLELRSLAKTPSGIR